MIAVVDIESNIVISHLITIVHVSVFKMRFAQMLTYNVHAKTYITYIKALN